MEPRTPKNRDLRRSSNPDIKSYRAKSMSEALQMIRRELGPNASVLHSREVRGGLLGWFGGGSQVEVIATSSVQVPSRLPPKPPAAPVDHANDDEDRDETPAANKKLATNKSNPENSDTTDKDKKDPKAPSAALQKTPPPARRIPAADETDFRAKFRINLKDQYGERDSLVENLALPKERPSSREMPQVLFQLFTALIDAELSDECARELIDQVRSVATLNELNDLTALKSRIARLIEDEIQINGPMQVVPGKRRLVALVGPTGVGKTTTIAKLAANFRLREQCRVGLITVDTYRIAAVEQLRTYADIMDLPMEVVSTPRELREALQRLSHLDLVLMDTAGRSPRDEVRIQELRSMLAESQPDEVHLVLSTSSGVQQLQKTAEKFAPVGVTSLMLTKLDEAVGLGHLLPLLRNCRLPLSYVTNGQNVPDDIESADRRKLARSMLGVSH